MAIGGPWGAPRKNFRGSLTDTTYFGVTFTGFPATEWQVFGPPEGSADLRTWTYRASAVLAVPPVQFAGFPVSEWQIPIPPEYAASLRTWTQNPQTLRGAVGLPPGDQVNDLSPRDYARPQDLRTWTWSYNRNLVGQDKLPTGEQIYDLAPRGYPEPATRTWLWSYNRNLIGQDRFPPGEIITDLSPRGYEYPLSLRSWVLNLQQTTLNTPVGKQVYDLAPVGPQQQPLRSWTWQYNVNLIGQDAFPVGDRLYDRLPDQPFAGQTWIGLRPPAVGVTIPFSQNDWPLPAVSFYPADLRTWIGIRPPITTAIPFSQDDWPNPRGPEQVVRTWTWQYNLNLIGKDTFPPGDRVTDLPPRDTERQLQLRTWTWSYNLRLIGQDAMAPGEQVTDLPPRAYPEPATRTWLWQFNPNLVGQDRLPNRQTDWPLPTASLYPTSLRTWIGITPPQAAVTFPFSQDDWPTPRSYPEPATRTWTWSYNLNLIGQDALPVGVRVTDLPPRDIERALQLRTWTWNYNLRLVGQDAMVAGKQITDLPPRAHPEPATRTWLVNLILTTLNTPVGKTVYDLAPRAYPEPATRTWLWNYNLNLIGQDRFPPGQIVDELPPRDYAQPAKTWTWNYNLNLIGQDRLPAGAIIDELPPRDYSRILQTWVSPLNLSLTTVVQPVPFNQYDWPLPRPLGQPDRGFAAFFNPNLIGKDQLPVGARLSDLPPRDHLRALQTWVQAVNLALATQVVALPFNQYDWPLPRPLGQPDRSLVAFYNPNLIGKDQLPVGARVIDLSPRAYPEPATRTWVFSYSLDLVGQDLFPPGARVLELAPIAPPHPAQTRTWVWWYNQNLIAQDRLPVGTRSTDLPPQDYARGNDLRTWLDQLNLPLNVTPATFPFSQYDWPLPRPLTQPDRSFIATFPSALIGQDRLPNRQQHWPLPTIALQPDRGFSASYNANLVGQDFMPAGARSLDLPPLGYEYPTTLRFYSQSPAIPPGEIPPPTVLPPGGRGVHARYFSRKRWLELLELIAAEEAVAAKARHVGSPARAEALEEAAAGAQEAIEALEGVEARAPFEPDMARLTAMLMAATGARKIAASITEAHQASRLAAELTARAQAYMDEEEDEIRLLLD